MRRLGADTLLVSVFDRKSSVLLARVAHPTLAADRASRSRSCQRISHAHQVVGNYPEANPSLDTGEAAITTSA